MTATEIELRAEVLTLRERITRLEKQLKDAEVDAEEVRNAFVAALDSADISEDTRDRIMINAAAELLMTAVAMPDEKRDASGSTAQRIEGE